MVLRLAILFIPVLAVSTLQSNFILGRRKAYQPNLQAEADDDVAQDARVGIAAANSPATEQYFLRQMVDHFNNSDNRTWNQRYFSNEQFWRKGQNVFLNLGGEFSQSIDWVSTTTLPWMQWASFYGAAVFSLEHRFYGLSRPLPDQSVENLKYLNSKQALADAANFIRYIKTTPGYENTKWIVFGGSYSGALALWMRQLYPDLVNGAVGSSPMMEAVFDFYQYLQVIQTSLGNTAVGGSLACVDKISAGFKELHTLMNTKAGRADISTYFTLKPTFEELDPPSYNDIQYFYTNIIVSFQLAVQYNRINDGPFATGYGIEDVCSRMDKQAKPIAGLVDVHVYMSTIGQNETAFEFTPNNYTEIVDFLQIEQYSLDNDPTFESADRSWMWQKCSEAFGFFETTDVMTDTIFGPVSPLNMFVNICQDVFGPQFTAQSISDNVDALNKFYGGVRGYRGTNVVIPNGSLDPWHILSGTYNFTDYSVVPYLISDTANCADMFDSNDTGIVAAHEIIHYNLGLWTKGPSSNRTASLTEATSALQQPTLQLASRARRSALQPQVVAANLVQMPVGPSKYQRFLFGRPPDGFLPVPDSSNAFNTPIASGSVDQIVDHFNKSSTGIFQQKFWKNAQWAANNGSTFLMLGGESQVSDNWIRNQNLTYLQWAEQLGATVYLLEHRYYGESKVSDDLTYLTSLQAVYDVATFILQMNEKDRITTPWIVFGGSYSGALAVWARELFPDLIAGAVGSSSPLHAKLDFYEYLEVMENSIRTYNKSYGDACADNIAAAFDEMHNLILDDAGVAQLNQLFQLNPPFDGTYKLTEIHKQFFFYTIYSSFQGAVQYTGDNAGVYAGGYGIPFMCSFMTNQNQTALNNTADFNAAMIEFYTKDRFTKTDNNYEDFVEYLKTGGPTNGDAAVRYWTWQTCNEFGFFQSTDGGYGIFGSPTPVNLFAQICKDVFWDNTNIDVASHISNAVEETNRLFGGRDNYRGTNVVLPSGSLDPWSALSKVQNAANDTAVAIRIEGTSHCADMYPARAEDPPSLTAARTTMNAYVVYWSKGGDAPTPPEQNTTVTETTTRGGGNVETTTPAASACLACLALLPLVISLLL